MRNKFITIMLCVALIATVVPLYVFGVNKQTSIVFKVSNASPKAGEIIDCEMYLGSVEGFGAMSVQYKLPTGLELVNGPEIVNETEIKSKLKVQFVQFNSGSRDLIISATTTDGEGATTTTDTLLLSFKCKVSDSATAGSSFKFDVNPDKTKIIDATLDATKAEIIEYTVSSDTITISDGTTGKIQATVAPENATFDKYFGEDGTSGKDLEFVLTKNDFEFDYLAINNVKLTLGTDYTVVNDKITVLKEKLSQYNKGDVIKLSFVMKDGGIAPIATVTINDNTPPPLSFVGDAQYSIGKGEVGTSETAKKAFTATGGTGKYTYSIVTPMEGLEIKNNFLVFSRPKVQKEATVDIKVSDTKEEKTIKVTIGEVVAKPVQTKNASVSPTTATFDKSKGKPDYMAKTFTLDKGTYEFVSLQLNGKNLQPSEYTENAGVFTLPVTTLEKLDVGDRKLEFVMSGGDYPYSVITVSDSTSGTTPVEKFNVTVTKGQAKIGGVTVTQAEVGKLVQLVANPPVAGEHFVEWKSTGTAVTFDATKASTTFTMPKGNVAFDAIYAKDFSFEDKLAYDVPAGKVNTTGKSAEPLKAAGGEGKYTYKLETAIAGLSIDSANYLVYNRPSTPTAQTTAKVSATDGKSTISIYVTIGEVTSDSAGGTQYVDAKVTPAEATFDKNKASSGYKDITLTLNKGSYNLKSITVNGTDFSDYTSSGDIYTISKNILEKLDGNFKIKFNMDGGVSPEATIKIIDSSQGGNTPAPKKEPKIIKGNEQTWVIGSKEPFVIVSDADYAEFWYVLIGKEEPDPQYCKVTEGSTVVTIDERYMNGLEQGSYDIFIASEGGIAEGSFKVKEAEVSKPPATPGAPETTAGTESSEDSGGQNSTASPLGDERDLALWWFVGSMALLAVAVVAYRKLKKCA